jgi:OPT oligopeptide transporter protein
MRLPPLGVGMGIYLPMALTLLIPIGAVIGHFYNRWALQTKNPEFAERMGVLMATGLIVGESLFGVVFAGIVAAANSDTPLALVAEYPGSVPLGIAIFALTVGLLYFYISRSGRSLVRAY